VRTDIRPAAVTDAEAIHRIYAPIVEKTAVSFEYVPPSVVEMAERITSTSRTYPYLVAVDRSGVCGYVYANAHRERAAYRRSVDTTVYIAPEARGRGVGRALYSELLPKLQRRGFHMAFAGIALPNPQASRFTPEVDRHLAFADYLRTHRAIAEQYQAEKLRAAALHPDNTHEYNDAKNDWIKRVEWDALQWWKANGDRTLISATVKCNLRRPA